MTSSLSGFSLTFSTRCFALALGMAVNVVLARLLGPSEFGAYALALTVVTMLAVPMHEGAATLLVREVARSATVRDWGRLRGALQAANVGVFATSICALALVVPFAWARLPPKETPLWMWALLLLPLYSLGSLRGAVLLGLQHPVLGQVPDQILRPLLLAIAVLLYSQVSWPGARVVMSLHVGAAFCAFLVGAALLLKVLPHEVSRANPEYHLRLWLRTLWPFVFIAGTQVINSTLAVLLLAYFGSNADVAFYRIAYLGASLVAMSLIAGDQVLAPRIAVLHASGDRIALQREITKMTRTMLLAALPVTILMLVFGEPLIRMLLGGAYVEAYWPLVMLILGQLINVGTGAIGSLLNMTGFENVAMRTLLATTLLNLALGVVLVPRFGASGAAAAATVAMVAMNLSCVWKAKTLLQIRSAPW